MSCYVYIVTNRQKGSLYIGVTTALVKRIWEHKNKLVEGFTKKYNIDKLVYFEETPEINSAIAREKQLKAWKREWKISLIEINNPDWKDLYQDLI